MTVSSGGIGTAFKAQPGTTYYIQARSEAYLACEFTFYWNTSSTVGAFGVNSADGDSANPAESGTGVKIGPAGKPSSHSS